MEALSCCSTVWQTEAPDACLDTGAWGQSLDLIPVLSKPRTPIFTMSSAATGKSSQGPAGLETQMSYTSCEILALQEKNLQQVTFTSPASLSHMLSSRHALSPVWPIPSSSKSSPHPPCEWETVGWTLQCTKLNKNLSRIVQEHLEYRTRCHICPLQGLESSGVSPSPLFHLHNTGMKGK